MYLNEHYIDHIERWDQKSGSEVSHSLRSKIVETYRGIPTIVEHKLVFVVKNPQTAQVLEELFRNHEFNVVTVTDFYIEDYNGIYNLLKGNISADAGTNWYTGTIWLEKQSDVVRTSFLQESFDNDFEELQPKTSTFGSLINGSAVNGTWGAIGSGFGCTADNGTNIYSIGYQWWNSIIIETDITLDSSGVEYVGFLINNTGSDFYIVSLSTTASYDVRLHRWLDATGLTLLEESLDVDLVAGNTYNLKCIYSAGRFDIFVDNKHIGTIYDYGILAGEVSLYDLNTNNVFTNFSVTQYIPSTINIPAGAMYADKPKLNRNLWTTTGLLQSYINIDTAPLNKTYTSRLHTSEVKVWDTVDNDFVQPNISPQSFKWQRVYDTGHKFKGDMYIENGIYGLLYTNDGLYHYVYDKPYRKGQSVWLDFKQNPHYEVWNESYDHRKFQSINQGIGNWKEEGLNFEAVYFTDDKDIIKNTTEIPELRDDTLGSGNIDNRLDMKLNKSTAVRLDEFAFATLGGHFRTNAQRRNHTYYNEPDDTIRVSKSTTSLISSPVSEGEDINITTFAKGDQDGFLIYKDGLLDKMYSGATPYSYDAVDFNFAVGRSAHTVWDDPFNGRIDYCNFRLINKGKVALRQLLTPLVWHSFDEKDWDHSTRTFIDKGSRGVDLSIVNTPKLQKNGRYNQCVSLLDANDDSIEAALTTELDNIDNFTLEFWIRYIDTIADGHNILSIWDGSYYTMGLVSDDTNLTGVIYQSGGSLVLAQYAHGTGSWETDQKWHHIALTNNGSDLIIYIDGINVANDTHTETPHATPNEILIGDRSVDMEIDELIISNYAKLPHEFGVIIPDAYETGQWYNNYEFNQDEHGGYYRNNNQGAIFEMDYIDGFKDRVTNQSAVPYGNGSIGIGKCGLGYGGVNSGNSSSYMHFYPEFFDGTKDFTLQFYFQRFNSGEQGEIVRLIGSSLAYFNVNTNVNDELYLWINGSDSVIDNNSYALNSSQIYHITVINDNTAKTLTLYVDGVLYLQYLYVEAFSTNMYLRMDSDNVDYTASNLTIHQAAIPINKFGIFSDQTPIPKYAGYINRYIAGIGGASFNTGHTLKSISPELVEIDVNEPNSLGVIYNWIESGNAFMYFDCKDMPKGAPTGYNGIEYFFSDNNHPRFALHMEDTPEAYDNNIDQASKGFSSATRDHGLYVFDFETHNMVFATATTQDVTYTNKYYARDDTLERIDSIITNISDGIAVLGFIPQRTLNEVFWDATEMVQSSGTYGNDSGNWFLSNQTTTADGLKSDFPLNYKRFPLGLYMLIVRGRVVSGSANMRMRNESDATWVSVDNFSNTSYALNVASVILKPDDDLDNLSLLLRSAASNTAYVDYMIFLPMSNGHDFLLDLVRRALAKTTKTKVLE